MNTPDPVVGRLADRLHATLAPLLPRGTEAVLVDYPAHDNVGDTAIWAGERAALSRLGVKVRFASDYWTHDDDAFVAAARGRTVLLHGGGNLGDTWPLLQEYREHLLSLVPGSRVVQLPQSVHFSDGAALSRAAAAFGQHPDLTVLVRDAESLAVAEDEGLGVRALLAPDSAFALRRLDPPTPVQALQVLRRTDVESGADDPGSSEPTVDWVGSTDRLPRHMRVYGRLAAVGARHPRNPVVQRARLAQYDSWAAHHIARGVRMLGAGRVVATDRLHAHILCLLMGRPHVLVDSSYGKVSRFHRAWTAESPLVTLASSWPEALEAGPDEGGGVLIDHVHRLPGPLRVPARRRWLAGHGVVVGEQPYFQGLAPVISNAGRMELGDRFFARALMARSELATKQGGVLRFGNDVQLSQGCIVSASVSVTIGDFTRIGNGVYVSDDNFHETTPGAPPTVAPIVLERNVWLATGVVVTPGVTIGRHSVVAANSVVTKDVPPCSVVAGTPARVIRTFPEPPEGWFRA